MIAPFANCTGPGASAAHVGDAYGLFSSGLRMRDGRVTWTNMRDATATDDIIVDGSRIAARPIEGTEPKRWITAQGIARPAAAPPIC